MENPVIAAPGHKLYAGVDFTRDRWGVSTGVQYIKDLYTNVSKGKEKKESFVLWNLRANYRVCRYADVFVWGIERSGFFNGREKWAKDFENQRV